VLDSRYEMLERIGEGGMGVVYKGRQVSIDRIVAIKMLNQELAKDPNWVARFNREAKACSRLQHPNTIRMFDFGQTSEGRLFMAMEFLKGQSLREAIASGAPMAPVRVLKILIQCCASLAEAHNIGIIHRDIKPDNVFLLNLAGSPDFVKLLDFSVAKLLQESDAMKTQAGVVFGTPSYMSPEQGRGVQLDARSDLYALGILAFEMLTGNVPFVHANPMSLLAMHVNQPVPALPSNIPPSMQAVVKRTLEKDPAGRYSSATEMMQHCQQVFAELGARAAGMNLPHSAGAPPLGPPPAPPPPLGGAPAPAAAQKTMMAGQSPMAGMPGASGAPPPAAEQKTMMASQSPFAAMQKGGAPPPAAGAPPPAAGAPPPAAGAPPPAAGAPAPASEAKTMMAEGGAAAVLAAVGRTPQGAAAAEAAAAPASEQKTMLGDSANILAAAGIGPGGVAAGAPQMPVDTAPVPEAPKKTMLLDGSEGVVSFAKHGTSVPAAAVPAPEEPTENSTAPAPDGGATPLFWVICLLTGLGVGVLAYVAVLSLGN